MICILSLYTDYLKTLDNLFEIIDVGLFDLAGTDTSMLNIELASFINNKTFINFYLVPTGSLSNVRYYYNHFRKVLFLRAQNSAVVRVYVLVKP